MIPPSPWIGSTRTAAVFGPTAALAAAPSPNGSSSKPGANGPNPSRYCGSLEKPTIVVVRPWKLLPKARISALPDSVPLRVYAHFRASLIAVSTASAPVFIGKARS